MTAIPSTTMTKTHLDASTDDPKQARPELATNVDTFNALVVALKASAGLNVGDGLEDDGSDNLRVKLDTAPGIARSSSGIKLDIDGLGDIGTGNIDTAADYLVVHDATDSTHKKVLASEVSAPSLPSGTVIMSGASSVPAGYLECNGQAVSRSTYADLYAQIGTAYGVGNGTTTFNVPDMRDAFPVGVGTTYTRGDEGGAASDSITLDEDHLPDHKHESGIGMESADIGIEAYGYKSKTGFTRNIGSGSDNGTLTPWTSGAYGTDSVAVANNAFTVDTLPPYVGLQYFIKT